MNMITRAVVALGLALEFGVCKDAGCGRETFRFNDPGGLGDDWMHADDFVRVG